MMQTRLLGVVPQPIFRMGWIIQPMWDGSYEVYPRTDISKNVSKMLRSMPEAAYYIEKKNRTWGTLDGR